MFSTPEALRAHTVILSDLPALMQIYVMRLKIPTKAQIKKGGHLLVGILANSCF